MLNCCQKTLGLALGLGLGLPLAFGAEVSFDRDVRPILSSACLQCHGPDEESRKADLRLDTREGASALLESGRKAVLPGAPESSELIARITHPDPDERMPPAKSGKEITPEQIETLRAWIKQGAPWQEHWSYRPLKRPEVPQTDGAWGRTPIDAFILQTLNDRKLSPSEEADRFTLIRRLYFDLIGLPPKPEEIEAFVKDPDPEAYEKLVKKLLDSPHYGERWARHWLDVVKYADTHGYDKDKRRPNAWPYRDYVIRAFNDDKPYTPFVQEQLAGDVLAPDDPDGIVALGFIAAGPWDLIGHMEVPESKIDGKVARNLDRDDMVCNTLNAFTSLTIQCARCHNHKFDPITMEHYYSLQAVFASLDRADREYDISAEVTKRKLQLQDEIASLEKERNAIRDEIKKAGGERLAEIDRQLAEMKEQTKGLTKPPEHGWHSSMTRKQDEEKWVQVDLGKPEAIDRLLLRACFDDFGGIGSGFGFPIRFRVEGANDPEFKEEVVRLGGEDNDLPNPKLKPYELRGLDQSVRFVRVTATKLFHRIDQYMVSFAEMEIFDAKGNNLAVGKPVTSLDTIHAPIRWRRSNLVDGIFPSRREPESPDVKVALEQERVEILQPIETEQVKANRDRVTKALKEKRDELGKLPKGKLVYAGTVHKGKGNFGGRHGKGPREIRILHRGEVTKPGPVVAPGTIPVFKDADWRFNLPEGHDESQRRATLATWITREDHPLTWRSIVNRVWLYHFGQGLVDSPNDFGRMGLPPTHPELLDWLAVEFRDGGQTFKKLHELIVMSSVYRQASTHREDYAAIDGNNRWYWRMNRRRLDAEALRDSVLSVSGKLDKTMYGPGFFLFKLEKDVHSPHYEYHLFDPEDPTSHRRSVYRFIVRSQPDPFMTTLDCADSSQSTPKRTETVTALQALSLLNNKFTLAMATHFAERVKKESKTPRGQARRAHRLATGQIPDQARLDDLAAYAETYGLENLCRLLFNLNEFAYVD